MDQAGRAILERMLERLFAAIVSGPSMNCRPHHSRQRADLSSLAKFKDVPPASVLAALLSEEGKASIRAAVPAPPPIVAPADAGGAASAEDDEKAEAPRPPGRTSRRPAPDDDSPARREWRRAWRRSWERWRLSIRASSSARCACSSLRLCG